MQPTPRWEIVSGSATINLDDYAMLRNAVMRVKDVPVFYLPVLYYPIQSDDRATGFLLPTYGTSTYRGQSLSNAFFWAINRSQDPTLSTTGSRERTGRRRRVSLHGVRRVGGQLPGLLAEREDATIDTRTGRSNSAGAAATEFSGGVRSRCRPACAVARGVDYFSDVTTQQLYNTNIYEASRRASARSAAA